MTNKLLVKRMTDHNFCNKIYFGMVDACLLGKKKIFVRAIEVVSWIVQNVQIHVIVHLSGRCFISF